jgi:hypothetical protein
MIKIAIDTSCLNVKKKCKYLNILDKLYSKNKIEIISSTVLEKEQNDNPNSNWRNQYQKRINDLNKKHEVGRWGTSSWGQCLWGNENLSKQLIDIINPKTKNDIFDLWILETAIANKCDYFCTLNKKDFIYNGKKELIEKLGIKVRIPDNEFIQEIEQMLSQ